jgi:hypothetical protein
MKRETFSRAAKIIHEIGMLNEKANYIQLTIKAAPMQNEFYVNAGKQSISLSGDTYINALMMELTATQKEIVTLEAQLESL